VWSEVLGGRGARHAALPVTSGASSSQSINKFLAATEASGIANAIGYRNHLIGEDSMLAEMSATGGAAAGDCDGDGDVDLILGGMFGDPSLLYRNNGDGTFRDVTAGSGIDTLEAAYNISSAFGDCDLDGDVDLLVSHWGTVRNGDDPGDTEYLWRNDSSNRKMVFTSVGESAGLWFTGAGGPLTGNLSGTRWILSTYAQRKRYEIDRAFAAWGLGGLLAERMDHLVRRAVSQQL
jgi:hypothetical protein